MKYLLALLLAILPAVAGAQTFGSPHFHDVTVTPGTLTFGSLVVPNTPYDFTSGTSAGMGYLHPFLTGTPTNAHNAGLKIETHDTIASTLQQYGVWIDHDVAPGGTSASGSRIALEVDLNEWGTEAGGAYTNLTDSTALRTNVTMNSNRGGTSSNYQGEAFALNGDCIAGSATYVNGCVTAELDSSSAPGYSYLSNHILQLVLVGTSASDAYLNANTGVVFGNNTSGTVGLLKYGIRFNEPSGSYAFKPYSALISVAPTGTGGSTPTVETTAALDFAQETIHGYAISVPFQKIVPLQATSVTTATRLTSDGLPADGHIQEAFVGIKGTGYTGNPTVAVSGCSGTPPVVNASTAGLSFVSRAGVYTAGSGCSSDAAAAVSGGGGSGTTLSLQVQGNTLNFPNQTVADVKCTVAGRAGGQAIGWSITFGVLQNGTASTTAIIGTPAWTQDFATASAPGDISIAAPMADTTLGAINITVTPTSLSWTIGGSCTMTGTTQVL